MDLEQALVELGDMVAATSAPVLGTAELEAILNRYARPDLAGNPPTNVVGAAGSWAASTAVLAGAVVLVGARYWRCLSPGVTAATAPTWPDLDDRGGPSGHQVTDGDVRWIDNGSAWRPSWDLVRAAAAGWESKAGKAVGMFDFATGDQEFSRSQVVAQCREMARHYRSKIVGSALIGR